MNLDAPKLKKLAESFIAGWNIMTLATTSERGVWAAPVYYVYLDSCFYFFSDPESRHVRDALMSGQAACAISAFSASWRDIRGIQMKGRIKPVSGGWQAVNVFRAYIQKYSFVSEFFDSGQDMDPEMFLDRFRVKLYQFTPDETYYLDNSIRFGFREAITL